MAFACLGLERIDETHRWGGTGLRLTKSGLLLGRLYALSAVAAAMVRGGKTDAGLPLLRAAVADPDFPAVYSTQARHELELAEAGLGGRASPGTDAAAAIDLDRTIEELTREPA